MVYQTLSLGIADLGIAIRAQGFVWEFDRRERYYSFLTHRSPDIDLCLSVGLPSLSDPGQLLFDAGRKRWRLYRRGEEYVFRFYDCMDNYYPRRIAIFNSDFTLGQVHVLPKEGAKPPFLYPLVFPLEQLILTNLLCRGRGAMLHAGAVVRENGFASLFPGPSGAGKSTMSRLWMKERGVTLLNDDQVVIRRNDRHWFVYGTPWGGDAGVVSPQGAPLDSIFFLHHAPRNAVAIKHPIDALSSLVNLSFPLFYERKLLDFTVGFLGDLVAQVPCYDLEFLPDARVLDLVEGLD